MPEKSEKKPLTGMVFNIQRYSIHDGPESGRLFF
jgi:pyruvate-formate lyase-activating enzyme